MAEAVPAREAADPAGATWSVLNGPTEHLSDLAYTEKHQDLLYIAQARPPRLFRSTDGVRWQPLADIPATTRLITGITSNGTDLFVVIQPESPVPGHDVPYELYYWNEPSLSLLPVPQQYRSPVVQVYCKAVATSRKVHFFGGINGENAESRIVTEYDLRTHIWSSSPQYNLTQLPVRARCLQAIRSSEHIVLMGGFQPAADRYGSVAVDRTLVFFLDPVTHERKWLQDRPQHGLPCIRRRAAVCLSDGGGCLIEVGGERGDASVDDCAAYHLNMLGVRAADPVALPRLPTLTRSASLVAFRGTLYAVGGMVEEWGNWKASIYTLPISQFGI
eukprot:scpid74788/ scgid2758/ 